MNFTLVDKCVLLCAKRNSGKSILLRYLISQEKDEFDKIFVICPTEKVAPFYNEFVPQNCVFDSYSDAWVLKLIESMTKIKGEGKTKKILLIMDDLVGDANFFSQKGFKILFTRSRHLGISVAFNSQFLHSIPPLCRNNSDFILCGQMNQASLEILANEFLSGNLSRQEFYQLYKDNTKDYSFLVISNSSSKNNSPEEIFGNIKTPIEYIK